MLLLEKTTKEVPYKTCDRCWIGFERHRTLHLLRAQEFKFEDLDYLSSNNFHESSAISRGGSTLGLGGLYKKVTGQAPGPTKMKMPLQSGDFNRAAPPRGSALAVEDKAVLESEEVKALMNSFLKF